MFFVQLGYHDQQTHHFGFQPSDSFFQNKYFHQHTNTNTAFTYLHKRVLNLDLKDATNEK